LRIFWKIVYYIRDTVYEWEVGSVMERDWRRGPGGDNDPAPPGRTRQALGGWLAGGSVAANPLERSKTSFGWLIDS
jgi:hypothetical protein